MFKFGEPALLLPNLELSHVACKSAGTTKKIPKNQTPSIILNPKAWIKIIPKAKNIAAGTLDYSKT